MSFITGVGAKLQIGKETTWGTGVTPTANVNLTSESIEVSVSKGDEGSLLASKTPMSRDLLGVSVGGSVSFVLRPEFAGLLFSCAMGGTDTVTAEGSLYKHSIKLADTNTSLPGMTIVVDREAAVKKYAGCTVGGLSLSAGANDYVTGSFDIIGVKEESGTVASINPYTVPSYRCTSAKLIIGGNEIDAESTDFNISNSLQEAPRTYSNTLYAGRPEHGLREVTFSAEIPYSDVVETLKDTYLTTETNASVSLEFTSSTTGYKLKISCPHCAVTSVSGASVSGSGILTSSVDLTALAVGTDEPCVVEIIDANSTAY